MTALASPSLPDTDPEPRPRGAGHLVAPLVVFVLSVAGLYALWRVALRTTVGQRVDTAAMNGADVHHTRVVEVLDRTLNGTSLASLVLVCLFAAIFGVLRRRADLAIGAALLVIGANVTTQLLKMRLYRPDLDGADMPNSFPSGHTAAAASVAFAVILVLPQALRGTIALVGFGYVTIIAVATVWAAWHRPSDTVGALLVTLAWGSLAVFFVRLRRLRQPGITRRPSRVATIPLIFGGLLTGLAGGLGLAVVAGFADPTGRLAFFSGSAAITAAAAGAFLVWVWLTASPGAIQGGTK
ncbi:phosphatase PAP2 family protein [Actinoplanes sp. NPDC049596]|uniref:phosphatase PAP2 family protein n=1 Tax=unclassified Actinoplanes TaxID=2626549 RepID=UPI0034435867